MVKRLKSIDVFRAVTMFFMIFVNDADGIKNIPAWIKHVGKDVDGLGFADTIFPAFLFIVGLSIPFSINAKLKSGWSVSSVLLYIFFRSAALLIMGFIHVNLEHYNQSEALLSKPVWEITATLAFFLIWMDYPDKLSSFLKYLLQILGIVILIVLGFLFRGSDQGRTVSLLPYWWGILGLIGWAYLICSIIFLFSKGNLLVLLLSCFAFYAFNIGTHVGWINDAYGIKDYIWIAGNGSMPVFTMIGVIISILYIQMGAVRISSFLFTIALCGIVMLCSGFMIRPYTGISKIHDTPAWVGICSGINILVFLFFVWLIDLKKKEKWFKVIAPAGTSTLTCYLIPYILYSILELLNFHYPPWLNSGYGGLIRSLLLAFLIILMTGWLEKKQIRLKI